VNLNEVSIMADRAAGRAINSRAGTREPFC